jgi:pilus assembly protein Flp/PilA
MWVERTSSILPGLSGTQRMEVKRMNSILALVTTLFSRLKREEGQALVEYGLILALVAVVVVGVLVVLGHTVSNTLNNVANSVGG